MPNIIGKFAHRLAQGMNALAPSAIPPHRDDILAQVLSDDQAAAFRGLPPYDQAHLLASFERLRAMGATDRDVLAAALLHDLGKADEIGQVRFIDRVVRVLLRRAAPRSLDRLASSPRSRLLHGLHLCVHHPRLGAEHASRLGCSPRTVWLIAHHEDANPGGDLDLERLQRADHG